VSRKFYLVPVESFHAPCVLFPDMGHANAAAYLRLLPKTEWIDQFVDYLQEEVSDSESGDDESEDND